MKNKYLFAGLLFAVAVIQVAAVDKLATVAIVDMDKVYSAFESQTEGLAAFNEAKKAMQAELKVHTQALTALQSQRLTAQQKNDSAEVLKLDQQILDKAKFIKDYKTVKEQELENMKQSLARSDKFKDVLEDTIQEVAISQGFSIVMLAGAESDVYWWVSDVDITRKVISSLKDKIKN